MRLLPKALPFASTTRAPPETGPGAPKRLRAGSRAALVRQRRGSTSPAAGLLDCWTRPTCRFAAEGSLCGEADAGTSLTRGCALHIVLGYLLGLRRTSARAIPHRCATAWRGRSGKRGRALIFCKARGFSSVRWRDLGAATYNLPKNPHPRRLHGRNGVVRASLLPGRRRAAKSVQVVLQRRSRGSQAGFRACRTLRRRRPTPEQRAPRPKAPKKRSLHTRRVGTKKCSPSAGCSYYLPRRARSCACRRRRRRAAGDRRRRQRRGGLGAAAERRRAAVRSRAEIKIYDLPPSTRRLLDGVAMSVPHRSTEPARPHHRREMTS